MSLAAHSMMTEDERHALQEQLKRTAENDEIVDRPVKLRLEEGEVYVPRLLSRSQWEYYTYVMEGYVDGIRRIFFFFGGATGVGKSVVTAHLVRDKALKYPGKTIVVGRWERTKLKDQFWPILLKHIPEELIVQKSFHAPLQVTLYNGTRILGVGIKELETVIGMSDIAGIFLEEVHECEGDEIRILTTRLREGVDEDMRQSISMTGNPHPGWVRDNMVINPIHVDGRPVSYFHPAKIEDNPFIKQKQYREMLRLGLTEEQYQRMANGDWSIVGGLTYKKFDRSHIYNEDTLIKPIDRRAEDDPKPNVYYACGLDWGQTHPTVSLWGALDSDGIYWIFDEWHAKYSHPETTTQILLNRSWDMWGLAPKGTIMGPRARKKLMGDIYWRARPDVKRRELSGDSPYKMFRRAGLPLHVYPGMERIARVERLKWLLERNRIRISSRCKLLIQNFQKNEWDEDKDEPKKTNDDALDALMYLLDALKFPPQAAEVYGENTPGRLIHMAKNRKAKRVKGWGGLYRGSQDRDMTDILAEEF